MGNQRSKYQMLGSTGLTSSTNTIISTKTNSNKTSCKLDPQLNKKLHSASRFAIAAKTKTFTPTIRSRNRIQRWSSTSQTISTHKLRRARPQLQLSSPSQSNKVSIIILLAKRWRQNHEQTQNHQPNHLLSSQECTRICWIRGQSIQGSIWVFIPSHLNLTNRHRPSIAQISSGPQVLQTLLWINNRVPRVGEPWCKPWLRISRRSVPYWITYRLTQRLRPSTPPLPS